MNNKLFSYKRIRIHKERALKSFSEVDYLANEMEKTLYQRVIPLIDMKKNYNILIIGCPANNVISCLYKYENVKITRYSPLLDEDFYDGYFPFLNEKFDIIIESFVLHWINDPIKYINSIKNHLCNNGIYLLNFLGGNTLQELRHLTAKLDDTLFKSAIARVSPMIKAESITKMMQQCQFVNTVVDQAEIKIEYINTKQLINDLRMMGENNSLNNYKYKFYKNYAQELDHLYKSFFINKCTNNIYATFNIINAIGWI